MTSSVEMEIVGEDTCAQRLSRLWGDTEYVGRIDITHVKGQAWRGIVAKAANDVCGLAPVTADERIGAGNRREEDHKPRRVFVEMLEVGQQLFALVCEAPLVEESRSNMAQRTTISQLAKDPETP